MLKVNSRKILLAIRIVTLGGLLLPIRVSSQMPSLAKLVVKSNPDHAHINLNDQSTDRVTDAVFVVAPNTYRVSVSGSANCGDKQVILQSGDTKTITCSGGAWTGP
jgi:hypothetical protein